MKEFNIENFLNEQKNIFSENQGEQYLSKRFKEEVRIRLSLQTPQSMFKDFKRWGYLFRVTEEKFGQFPNISIEKFLEIKKNRGCLCQIKPVSWLII